MPRVTVFRGNPSSFSASLDRMRQRAAMGMQFYPLFDGGGRVVGYAAGYTRKYANMVGRHHGLQVGGRARSVRALGELAALTELGLPGEGRGMTKSAASFHPGLAAKNPPRRRAAAKRARRNPPARQLGTLVSGNVHEIRYTHVQDGRAYKHSFGPNVCAELLDDGSVRLFHAKGKPLMREF